MSSGKSIGYSLKRNRVTASRHSIKTRRWGSCKPLKAHAKPEMRSSSTWYHKYSFVFFFSFWNYLALSKQQKSQDFCHDKNKIDAEKNKDFYIICCLTMYFLLWTVFASAEFAVSVMLNVRSANYELMALKLICTGLHKFMKWTIIHSLKAKSAKTVHNNKKN